MGPGRRAIDLDEAIIRNERYLRTRSDLDGKYLVSLEDLAIPLSIDAFREDDILNIVRKDPPKGGEYKPFYIQISPIAAC